MTLSSFPKNFLPYQAWRANSIHWGSVKLSENFHLLKSTFLLWDKKLTIKRGIYTTGVSNHLTLPNDKILDVTKFKAFADNKLNVA